MKSEGIRKNNSSKVKLSEFEILNSFNRARQETNDEIIVPGGDDAAVISLPNRLVVCADIVVEGVHFSREYFSLSQIANKAVVVNISDLAAMGSTPKYLLAVITSPGDVDLNQLLTELDLAAKGFGARLIGGDISSGKDFSISITAIGEIDSKRRVMVRSGAIAGESIFVTGPLGGASMGLKLLQNQALPQSSDEKDAIRAHLEPNTALKAGLLISALGIGCAIDISDGLLGDLEHIAEGSKVGINLTDVPIARGASLSDALNGGEDYELIFTASMPEQILEAFKKAGLTAPYLIGECTAMPDQRHLFGKTYQPKGWQHFN
ncbi:MULTISPECIES: thiamine-phosphate kinase [Acidithrix]|uniref:Thiamine-monophosphate kinase n=1 Tax=Acidithrix ferrooxidans TaxID=1280514 RepID=A0A0D8HGH2_9ACTN|nr:MULTISPECIES: thiamine-phosphate kinase [Acidithrix]KJF16944.1 thiamine-monophosphate kinase [Acidithrix ferrooxidans]